MNEQWIVTETKSADFKDERINARFRDTLSMLAEHPTASIPCASGGHAEMTAAYRLFDNPKVTMERILQPHAEASIRRIAEQKTVVLVQDTSEINLTRPVQQVCGAGPLGKDKRLGFFLHPLHAFTPDGTPLGTVGLKHWTRDWERKKQKDKTSRERASEPFESKESYRWLDTLRRADEISDQCPNTKVICVCDSEADIYEMMSEKTSVNWIIRGCQNRVLNEKTHAGTSNHIRESVLAQNVIFETEIDVRSRTSKIGCDERGRRQSREPRKAVCDVRSACVSLRPPWRPGQCKLPSVDINVVLVRERLPPSDEEPIEWMLLTDLPVETESQLLNVIQLYATRWMIEVYFKVLKSGCLVEKRRFENIKRCQTCIAIYMIIAWRTLYLCRLARSVPDINCEAVFEPDEWKPVWQIIRKSPPPTKPPSLGEVIDMVAQLGGYVKRKNSPPGPKTIWTGIQRAYDFAICWKSFGPSG
jgi:hypothetical protein